MKTEIPGVNWYLDCEPRPVQLEAMSRAYTGNAWRLGKDDPLPAQPLFNLDRHRPAIGFPYFMEMRLGKTPTALNEFIAFSKDHGFTKMLVFSPSKYKWAWGMEAKRFGFDLFDMPVHVYESSDRGRREAQQFIKGGRGLLVVNYEALIQLSNMKVLASWVDDRTYVAGDESVLMKNRNTLFFMRGSELAKDAAITRPLTGKPVVQSPEDLYAQLRFARKLEGVNFYQFRGTYCELGGFKGKKVTGIKNEERLRTNLNRWGFVAQRRDWGTWYEPDFMTQSIDFEGEQQRLYKQMEEEFVVWLEAAGESVSVDQVITKRMKMQQIASGFIYDENKKVHWLVPPDKNPKLLALKDDLENRISTKVIIIAVHKPVLQLLMKELAEYQPAIIAGAGQGDNDRDTETEKRRFNNDPACRVMLGQERAIKYGHTLMGTPDDPCEFMAYFENSYSLDDRAQSIERPQGEGQANALTVIDYCTPGVETEVIGALQRKEEVSHAILRYYGRL